MKVQNSIFMVCRWRNNDHGPKETAENSIVIQILAKGKSYERSLKLNEKIRASGAMVLTVEEPEVAEHFSIFEDVRDRTL